MARRPRSPESRAAFDAALKFADDMRAERQRQDEAFERPTYTRQVVADALGVGVIRFQHWHEIGALELDADQSRAPMARRLYSPRDVLRLAIALKLAEAGHPTGLLRWTMAAIEAAFPLRTDNPYFAANRPTALLVMPDGSAHGPEIGEAIEVASVSAAAFIVLRLDCVIRDALEPLGLMITRGSASDHRAAIERLEA